MNAAYSYAPAWAVSLLLLASAVVVASQLYETLSALLRRLLRRRQPFLKSILDAIGNPARAALILIALAIVTPLAPLGPEVAGALARVLVLATICLLGWIALTVLRIATNLYLLRFRIDVADNLLARKHVTQVRVLVRVLDTIIIMITTGFALMTFDAVRQYGLSLFASAGVAGIIAGLAARPVLTNLLAGVQLAVTQPIRIEDAVTVENEYGWVEEITSTYVVLRLWDLRRMIVPLSYFIEKPFFNWTRQAAANMGSVMLYLDYTAPVDRIRQKAIDLVGQSTRFPGKVVSVQVTNTSPQAIELRVLVAAEAIGKTADLCAELREKLIQFLQQEHPEALPRARSEAIAPPARNNREPPMLRTSAGR